MAMTQWKIDGGHSGVHFSVRHLVIATVRGRFHGIEGEVSLDENDLTSAVVDVRIDAASIDTANPQRDGELRSERFFDVEKFPRLAFRSRRIERAKGDSLCIVGDLTLHGVTREVVLDADFAGFVVDHRGNRRAAASIRGAVLRSDFGMSFHAVLENGGLVVSDRIEIAIDVEALALAANPAQPSAT
jgi:polyisoprenoid-binding protein YceI